MNGGRRNNRRSRFSGKKDEFYKHEQNKHADNVFPDGTFVKNKTTQNERLRWTAPELPNIPMITPKCPWCGNQINDITTAISDTWSQ